ncbi:D-glycero-beta-D-manno-heptose 1-phosphate adenylyltransferase [Saccharibacter floricola]|uniref:Bifunctional protein HldE n=1 Tax=Saccharibacter floricola DSM 15669 TaxID=1123227 RepID=A0ABQ0NZL2_9PROT|nr:D-glycero-beta-D-manno-heptose 1-phosphate adenylyltransferase [Saccharibacter floricola]GBQ07470.1 ADP-heptose synthase [Saccharibacter floricola DSM 15669]
MIENFKFGRVTVIGDIILDQYIMGSVSRVSPEAPVPVLLRSHQTFVPGGAANVAVNAASLGCSVQLLGIVGDDSSAQALRRALAAWPSIDAHSLVSFPGWPTITKTRVLSGRQQIVRIDNENTAIPSDISQKLIMAAQQVITSSDVIICSDYAKGALSDDVLRFVIDTARAHNIPVIVDPKRPDFTVYRGATLLTPNRTEMARATHNLPLKTDQDVEEASRIASLQFGGDVLLTRSEEGMSLWCRDGRIIHTAARKSEVFDVSGAGDTVIATVAAVLSAGKGLDIATTIATTAASLAVNKLGTSAVSRDELSRALQGEMEDSNVIVPLEAALQTVDDWKRHGARIVFTNGCFDLIHPGHISLIEGAARQGDKLIVALNTDASVRRLKGPQRPLQDQVSRAKVVSALRHVDLVLLFDEDTPLELIKALKPHILVKGADYREEEVIGGDIVKEQGGRVVLMDIVEGQSTTNIVHKMT